MQAIYRQINFVVDDQSAGPVVPGGQGGQPLPGPLVLRLYYGVSGLGMFCHIAILRTYIIGLGIGII